MIDKEIHEYFMKEVLKLAYEGAGHVLPNPMVGALICKKKAGKIKIIGKGYHKKFGGHHAEIEALNNCTEDPGGGILYVNLEPCSHSGKTGPCTEAIIKAGIKEVFISMIDPNPLIHGKGIASLEKANIKVRLGLLENESKKLNEIFIKWITKKEPFILIKTACTLDGKISLEKNKQNIIGNEKSLEKVHKLRQEYDSILVGINTILIDNPKLTTRLNKNSKNPIRIVLDSSLKIPLDSQIFAEDGQNIIVYTKNYDENKRKILLKMKNTELIEIDENINGKIDLHKLIKALSEKKITSILIEGGGKINSAFLDAELVDKINLIYSSKISGNAEAPSVFGSQIKKELKFDKIKTEKIDNDIWWEGYVEEEGRG